ncbi:MAG TPA: uroporphyrinogen-III C-methyltransferase [Rhodocyclaceae bacterium]|nr:uroporphyrinogen-III C-methyltransferase [Rhodocyclaceae bacterium]
MPRSSKNPSSNKLSLGTVYVVGAGPGDADLLTLRAARLIGSADALVYDHLVGDAVLALARPDVERIYAGKEAGHHTLPQGDINQLLVRLSREGKQVVRLKGGDPFIFGRGGEEAAQLAEAGIPFEVVPGVTAACGAAAFAGIPLTHRDHAQSCLFVTGHLKDNTCDLDWPTLARPGQTVVIYMGLGALPEISRRLLAAGMAANMPAACISNASLPNQMTITGTIADLPKKVNEAGIKSPALLIIGNVVGLRAQLKWFE